MKLTDKTGHPVHVGCWVRVAPTLDDIELPTYLAEVTGVDTGRRRLARPADVIVRPKSKLACAQRRESGQEAEQVQERLRKRRQRALKEKRETRSRKR